MNILPEIVLDNVKTNIDPRSMIYKQLQMINENCKYEIVIEKQKWHDWKWFKKIQKQLFNVYNKLDDYEAEYLFTARTEQEIKLYLLGILHGNIMTINGYKLNKM